MRTSTSARAVLSLTMPRSTRIGCALHFPAPVARASLFLLWPSLCLARNEARCLARSLWRSTSQDWIGVGGWAGGELGLKEASVLQLPEGTRVRIKGEAADWKKNGLFANVPSLFFAGASPSRSSSIRAL